MHQQRNDAHMQVRMPQQLLDDVQVVAESVQSSKPDLLRQWIQLMVFMHHPNPPVADVHPHWPLFVKELGRYIEQINDPKNVIETTQMRLGNIDMVIEHLFYQKEALTLFLDAIKDAIAADFKGRWDPENYPELL